MDEESKKEKSAEEKHDEIVETRKVDETTETMEKEEEAEEERPPTEEEIKPKPRREVEEEFVEERIYTIPLGKAWIAPPRRRAPRAMKIIRDFVKRHMKLKEPQEESEEEEPKSVIVSNDVNKRVWKKGIQKPPRKVRVRAAKDKDGNITVFLAE